jgi:hypothetical protein
VSAHREEHLELCAARALGSIDEADRAELERHLAGGCPECERALSELGHAVEQLAMSAPAATPRAELRSAVMDRVRAEAAASPRASEEARTRRAENVVARDLPPRALVRPARPRVAWSGWALAAAAAVLAVSTFAAWRVAEGLRVELAAARGRLAQAERDLAIERAWSAVSTSPGARVVDLAPLTGGATLPRVRATYDPSSRRAVIAFEDLTTPAGSDFELWAVLPDGPKSLGVVRADANGRAQVRIEDAGSPETLAAFALSLEREGGSPDPRKPAGPVVLAGSVRP